MDGGKEDRRKIRKDVKSMGRVSMKERLRKRCMERIKRQREALLKKSRGTSGCRGALRSIIRSEMEKYSGGKRKRNRNAGEDENDMVGTTSIFPSCQQRMRFSKGEEGERDADVYGDDEESIDMCLEEEMAMESFDEIDMLRTLEEMLYEDLRENESAFLKQLEEAEHESRRRDEEDIREFMIHEESEIAIGGGGGDVQTDVLCPICFESNLQRMQSTIFCRCGMRIDTEGDGLDLGDLKRGLAGAIEAHFDIAGASGCTERPVFEISRKLGVAVLIAKCEVCDFLKCVV